METFRFRALQKNSLQININVWGLNRFKALPSSQTLFIHSSLQCLNVNRCWETWTVHNVDLTVFSAKRHIEFCSTAVFYSASFFLRNRRVLTSWNKPSDDVCSFIRFFARLFAMSGCYGNTTSVKSSFCSVFFFFVCTSLKCFVGVTLDMSHIKSSFVTLSLWVDWRYMMTEKNKKKNHFRNRFF